VNTEQQLIEITLCGLAAIDALASAHPERIVRFFFSKERAARFGDLCSRLAEDKKIYRLVEADELEKISSSIHHQGVAAVIHYPTPQVPQAEDLALWAKENRTLLVLDNVSNTHNLGTMIRTAAFLGIKDIVICGRSLQASKILSTSMYRTAEGGMEFCTIWYYPSAAQLLKTYPYQANPGILGLAADHYASKELKEIPEQLRRLPGADSEGRIQGTAFAIVMGNEEEGLSKQTKAACFLSARISGDGGLESLNVSQAAAIFMYFFAHPSGTRPGRLGLESKEERQERSSQAGNKYRRSGPSHPGSRKNPKEGRKFGGSARKPFETPDTSSAPEATAKRIRTIRLKKN